MRALAATTRSLSYRDTRRGAPVSVDVLLDGQRVWSTTPLRIGGDGGVRLAWPKALRPYLRGTGELQVRESASGAVVAAGRVRLGGSPQPFAVRDASGRRLVVTKWNRMGPVLDESSTADRERLLERTAALLRDLEALGYTSYIVGGTLLGAVRDGAMLPHDDDSDLAVLLEHSDPADLSLDSFALEDRLTRLGYLVVRHSSTHLQLTFLHEDGRIDQYIDVFLAFYRGEHEYCQPFHVRYDVPRSSILPLGTQRVDGHDYPAPRVPEDWLVACYGPAWRTPDPSFRFDTPLPTRRRFENWFGSQNVNRVYWESAYGEVGSAAEEAADLQHWRTLRRVTPAGGPVLELGCGTGAIARALAAEGSDVIAVDYSLRALALAREADRADRVDWRYGNVYDRRRLLELGAELVRDGRRWTVSLDHLLEGLTEEGRSNVFLLLRLVLAPGGRVVATMDTNFVARRYSGDDPLSWHLHTDTLREEAGAAGFAVEVRRRGFRHSAFGRRTTMTAVIRRRGED